RTPPSTNLGSLPPSSSSAAWAPRPATRQALPVAAFLARESGHSRSTLGVIVLRSLREASPGASGLRRVGATFGKRTVGREGRHLGLNAERRELRVRPEKAHNWSARTVVAEPRRAATEVTLGGPGEPRTAAGAATQQRRPRACGIGHGT
ncbi:mCG1031532, partial [Mus musculus]